jgi:hypothetical protein
MSEVLAALLLVILSPGQGDRNGRRPTLPLESTPRTPD